MILKFIDLKTYFVMNPTHLHIYTFLEFCDLYSFFSYNKVAIIKQLNNTNTVNPFPCIPF